MTSPGQVRLRELLVDAAAGIDPTVNWDKQRLLLLEIRAAVMSDPAITTDAITGQNLRLPAASPTYAAVQQAEIHGEAHPEWTIDADAVLYSDRLLLRLDAAGATAGLRRTTTTRWCGGRRWPAPAARRR